MLREMDDHSDLCEILTRLLNAHLAKPHTREGLGCWDKIKVPLLPKKPGACNAQDFRAEGESP